MLIELRLKPGPDHSRPYLPIGSRASQEPRRLRRSRKASAFRRRQCATGSATITGNNPGDIFTANSAADSFIGGTGNDVFFIGTGNGTVTGGGGSDTVVFSGDRAGYTVAHSVAAGVLTGTVTNIATGYALGK